MQKKSDLPVTAILQLFLELGYPAYVSVLINTFLYLVLSWPFVNHVWLSLWACAMCAVVAYRVRIHFLLNSEEERGDSALGAQRLVQMKKSLVATAFLFGIMGSLFLKPDSHISLTATTFILAGMTAGAVVAYSSSLSTVRLYLYPSLLPFIIRLFTCTGLEYKVMGMLGTLYLVVMNLISKNTNRKICKLIQLNNENENLIRKIRNANHEVRTPLTAIKGFAELLANEELNAESTKKYSRVILRNSTYLSELVENILLLSSPENRQENEKRLIFIKDELQSAFSTLEKRLKEKNLAFEILCEKDYQDCIYVHSLKFQQILVNILSNAVKFTPRGKITVEVKAPVDNRLKIIVSDTGIGIGKEAASKLFEFFYREDRAEVKNQEGSGIGLALSRNLAVSMGGSLKLLKSEVGRGSAFELEFDIAPPSPAPVFARPTLV